MTDRMIDITHKHTTLREAIAEATVLVSLPETIAAVKEKRVPKGDVLEAARVAGLFGIKRTSEMIPDCHPLPIEHAEVTFSVEDMAIVVKVKVRTIYRTGVEVEAMHGASVAALTIYDMLKPIDKGISIERIRLLEKKGGKSDWKDAFDKPPRAAVLIISDGVASGKKEDKAGAAIIERLRNLGVQVGAQAVVAAIPRCSPSAARSDRAALPPAFPA
jgi:cyclic pyranopterin phosphate synthase